MALELIHESRLRGLYGGVCTVQTPSPGTPARLNLGLIQGGLYGTNLLRGAGIGFLFPRSRKSSSSIPVRRASPKERFHGQ